MPGTLPATAGSTSPTPALSPRLIVFSGNFPSKEVPTAGTFIKERLFRVGKTYPMVVVAPQPWSPLDGLVRLKRKSYRQTLSEFEVMEGIEVYRPKFLSLPGFFKRADGWFMYRACTGLFKRLQAKFKPNVLDAHFLYPDGYAASKLAKQFGLPLFITIRGSKDEWLIGTDREPMLLQAMNAARHLISVSAALKRDVAERLGIASEKVTVIGNGIDLAKFQPLDKLECRKALGISPQAKVIIGVGALHERKGFHRVIPVIAQLKQQFPDLVYLIVGGGTSQGDMLEQLKAQAQALGVQDAVRFCGPQAHAKLKEFYSAADIFALATAHEGWANVFLEAMACGLPVITTNVGGNREVVAQDAYGTICDFWNEAQFTQAAAEALNRNWDRKAIRDYACSNEWDSRIQVLNALFVKHLNAPAAAH